MERCSDIKLQLKKWEASFFDEHQRRPSKADVAEAPEEIKNLYRKYKSLKEGKEHIHNSESEAVSQPQPCKLSMTEQAPELGCWGAHLNRGQVVPKPTLQDRFTAKASAQYFGMKLKSNLGAAIKEYPISLKKILTSKRKPLTVQQTVQQATDSAPSEPREQLGLRTSLEQPPIPDPELPTAVQLPSVPGLTPSKLSFSDLKPRLAPRLGEFQQLKQAVTKRLSSLDPGWLDRCQGPVWVNEGQKRDCCPAGDGADPSEGSPGHSSPGKCHLSVVEGRQEANCESSRDPGQGKVPETPPPIPSTGDDFGPKAQQPNWASSTSLSKAKDDFPATQEKHNLEFFSEIDSQQREMGEETSQRPSDASCEVKNGQHHPPKRGKNSGKKRPRDPDTQEDGGRDDFKSDAAGTKRKRAKGSDGGGPAEKPGGASRMSGLEEHESDSKDTLEVPEEKETTAPVPSENLLGEVDGEGCPKWKRRSSSEVCRAPPKTENFVRLNLKKKSHVKGYALKGRQLRKQVWKQKWQKKGEQFGGGGRNLDRGSDTCFRCGGLGHWASQCKERVREQDSVTDVHLKESSCEEEVPLLTLEEVAQRTNTAYSKIMAKTQKSNGAIEEPQQQEEVIFYGQRPVYESAPPPAPTEPLYKLGQDGKVKETPPEVFQALADLGYSSFRPGQEAAVMRILSGLSTLVVLSTGMGKSLCYQLPAYLYRKRSRCITLVISPLVSLMDDQVSGLPQCLKAVCLHSNMSKAQREAAVEKVKSGKVQVLLLSPEALVGGGLSGSSCLPPADQLPPVAFACIDEAHCVSQWSHNFRPCYLRLCKVLRDRLGVRCFLGLTATATRSTAKDVARHLGIPESEEVSVLSAGVPPNLQLSVSTDRDKDQALVKLLQGERFGSLDSVIVYCTRREEASRIAALIRTCLQGVKLRDLPVAEEKDDDDGNLAGKRKKAKAKKSIRRPLKWISEAYHAGMSSAERRRVQNSFMSGELRVVVATVAFGMGLDKSDVRGVVHYNMPKNFESYVQEIGRAGRDGKPAQCHLFLHPEGEDLHELRRHIYADTVDFFTVKRLVQKVFPRCKCREFHQKKQELNKHSEVEDAEMLAALEEDKVEAQKPRVCHRHERAIPIEQTVEALDFREEGIETLLCYLDLHPCHWVELLHPTFSSCRLVCYGGPQELRRAAQRCPPLAVHLARQRLKGTDLTHTSSVEFDVVELADTMGWELLPVKRALRQLQWETKPHSGTQVSKKSGVLVEFSELSFHLRSYGDLTDEELDSVFDFLHGRVRNREKAALLQLQTCFQAFQRVALRTYALCCDHVDEERSNQLKSLLMDYFEKDTCEAHPGDEEHEVDSGLQGLKLQDWEEQIRADIRNFLAIREEEKFSGRAVARIFHGIGSPRFPAQIYGRDRRFWRKYIHFDFNRIMQMATEEIIRWR